MVKTVAAGLTALFVTASSLAYAQAPSATTATGGEQENTKLSAADLNVLTDARIGLRRHCSSRLSKQNTGLL